MCTCWVRVGLVPSSEVLLGKYSRSRGVGVLIGAALPGAAGLAEVDGGAQWFLKGGAEGELVAPVHGEGAAVWGARARSIEQ